MTRAPFPLWATLVPIVAALVLWLVTGSPLVLAFAALGPLAALAGRFDARRADRARSSRETTEAQTKQQSALLAESQQHEQERLAAWQQVIPLDDLLNGNAPQAKNQLPELMLGSAVGRPVTVPSQCRIGVVGEAVLTAGLARTIAVQQSHAGVGTVVQARQRGELHSCDAVIEVTGTHEAVLQHGLGPTLVFQPHFLAERRAADWFATHQPVAAEGALVVVLGQSETGVAHPVDLVAGPHALIAGATGSGKTELIRRWLLELCRKCSPAELAIVCLDFKGGSGVDDFRGLPQIASVLTDLDDHGLERVFTALRCELTRRERIFARSGVRSFDELAVGSLPRLLIVVDEFQLLLERAQNTTEVMADIAARGRALGLHLMLATQHPSRAIRDHIAANCGLRLALRLHDPAESRSLIGSEAAAQLTAGGQLLCRDEHGLSQWQVAAVSAEELSEAGVRWEGTARAAAPWLPELEPGPVFESLVQERFGSALAVIDDVQERAYRGLDWADLGSLRIQGPAGSGRSQALFRTAELSLAAGTPVMWIDDRSLAVAWEALEHAISYVGPLTVLIDNADDVLFGLEPEYRHAFIDRIRVLSQRPNLRLVFSSRAVTTLDERVPALLQLVGKNGAANWQGAFARIPHSAWRPAEPAPAAIWQPAPLSGIVTQWPERFRLLAEAQGWEVQLLGEIEAGAPAAASGRTRVQIGTAEQWLMQRVPTAQTAMLFADGNPAELRSLLRLRELPPLLAVGEGWWCVNGNAPVRVRTGARAVSSG